MSFLIFNVFSTVPDEPKLCRSYSKLILCFGELYVSYFLIKKMTFKIHINYMPVIFILIYLM